VSEDIFLVQRENDLYIDDVCPAEEKQILHEIMRSERIRST
jgi:hypothetical protein